MGIKMSGMASGLDTDAMIKELMSAQSLKRTKIEKKQTSLTWKQEIWKELNTKIYSLYTGTLSKMKTQGSYLSKKVVASDESKAGITVSNSASKGAHSLSVEQLASSQRLTGGVITTDASGKKAQDSTTLSSLGITENTVITIKGKDEKKEQKLLVDDKTTLADFVKAAQNAGLNANYDSAQGRLFISSKESGEEQKFTITTSAVSEDYVNAKNRLNDLTGYSSLTSADKEKLDGYFKAIRENPVGSALYDEAKVKLEEQTKKYAESSYTNKIDNAIKGLRSSYTDKAYKDESERILKEYATESAWLTSAEGAKWAADNPADKNDPAKITAAYNTAVDEKVKLVGNANNLKNYANQAAWLDSDAGRSWLADNPDADETAKNKAYKESYDAAVSVVSSLLGTNTEPSTVAFRSEVKTQAEAKYNTAATGSVWEEIKLKAQVTEDTKEQASTTALAALAATLVNYKDNSSELPAGGTAGNSLLNKIGLAEITGDSVSVGGPGNVSGLTVIKASDARIVLDGATMESSSNVISINNMTFNLKGVTGANEISFTVSDNADGTYDLIKGFVKEYNALLKEMNGLYDAKTAKGYEPLTSEEKEAMSDDEVEKWEKKIKDSLLRRDETISSVTNSMRSSLLQSVTVDGKSYSLASFGIRTSTDYTEKGLLHIYGDSEDNSYASETNLLRETLEGGSKAIERNLTPDALMKTISGLCQNLYDTMTKKMERSSISSALTFYNDKQMETQSKEYATQIKQWDKKLATMESRYYKQFTAMEVAMNKLQNQSSSLASLLGTGG